MPKLAVIGQPVSHSRSPAMQNAALAELGLAPEWSYSAIEVGAEGFDRLVASLAERGFAGANVTVPHKLRALAAAASASPAARAIGAANTLIFSEAGLHAENTDAAGLIAALPDEPRGERALVLGAGGSARACAWALREAGAAVTVWNRTPARGKALAAELGVTAAGEHERFDGGEFGLLVNATTVGLRHANGFDQGASARSALKSLPLDADAMRQEHIVVDLVYGSSPAPLAALARERGARVVEGLEVLVHQGAASLRLWTGLDPPLETMRRAAGVS